MDTFFDALSTLCVIVGAGMEMVGIVPVRMLSYLDQYVFPSNTSASSASVPVTSYVLYPYTKMRLNPSYPLFGVTFTAPDVEGDTYLSPSNFAEEPPPEPLMKIGILQVLSDDNGNRYFHSVLRTERSERECACGLPTIL